MQAGYYCTGFNLTYIIYVYDQSVFCNDTFPVTYLFTVA